MTSTAQYAALSNVRLRLTRLRRSGKQATGVAGITQMQDLPWLHLRGFPGRDRAGVGEPALRSQASHRRTAALIGRRAAMWLATKPLNAADLRSVKVQFTPLGDPLGSRIAAQQRGVLSSTRSVIRDTHVCE